MDLRSLTDEQFDEHRRNVLAEEERRQRLSQTPEQVAGLAAAYEKDGGDRSALVAAITERNES